MKTNFQRPLNAALSDAFLCDASLLPSKLNCSRNYRIRSASLFNFRSSPEILLLEKVTVQASTSSSMLPAMYSVSYLHTGFADFTAYTTHSSNIVKWIQMHIIKLTFRHAHTETPYTHNIKACTNTQARRRTKNRHIYQTTGGWVHACLHYISAYIHACMHACIHTHTYARKRART